MMRNLIFEKNQTFGLPPYLMYENCFSIFYFSLTFDSRTLTTSSMFHKRGRLQVIINKAKYMNQRTDGHNKMKSRVHD